MTWQGLGCQRPGPRVTAALLGDYLAQLTGPGLSAALSQVQVRSGTVPKVLRRPSQNLKSPLAGASVEVTGRPSLLPGAPIALPRPGHPVAMCKSLRGLKDPGVCCRPILYGHAALSLGTSCVKSCTNQSPHEMLWAESQKLDDSALFRTDCCRCSSF